jgi:hypothetical protein
MPILCLVLEKGRTALMGTPTPVINAHPKERQSGIG